MNLFYNKERKVVLRKVKDEREGKKEKLKGGR